MPTKKRAPAPIDRPLSKAYLREFDGWSTAYPPGLSEPNSIRVMENVQVTREGAARVRPGLQSYLRTKSPLPIVGSHELFYLPNGKAYLVAVRETVDVGTDDEREIVSFRVLGPDGTGEPVMDTLEAFGFDVPTDPHVLSFTGATTYVKYLQVDNKIFALSNAPEGMLMFWVGQEKKARKLSSIERPKWIPADKLIVNHPSGYWVESSFPTSIRENLCTNPDFEVGIAGWYAGNAQTATSLSEDGNVNARSLQATSTRLERNWATSPLHDVASDGTAGWGAENGTLSTVGANLKLTSDGGYATTVSNFIAVPKGEKMKLSFDFAGHSNARILNATVLFLTSSGDVVSNDQVFSQLFPSLGRKVSSELTVPLQAQYARLRIGFIPNTGATNPFIEINDVRFSKSSESTDPLSGDDGANYYWVGTPNESYSEYHPAQDIVTYHEKATATPGTYTVSADLKGHTGKQVELEVRALNSVGSVLLSEVATASGTGAFVRDDVTIAAPANTTHLEVRAWQRATGRNQYLNVDAVLLERSATAEAYFSGSTPNTPTEKYRWGGAANFSRSFEDTFAPSLPVAEVKGPDTLVSSDTAKNRYSFSFFYTVSNELGESAASQVTTIRTQRPWTAWEWLDPSGNPTEDPLLCRDQLTVIMPQAVFDAAVASGATHWTAYYYYQGPNDAPPVTATRFAEIDLSSEPDRAQHGWARITPQMVQIGVGDPLIPSVSTLFNASDPVKGAQGVVASDRLILVGNPADPARITWSSGAPGDYHNFSSLLGGGTKQLTSGNLYVTACVKLWQNPQSVDTLTILNMGDDGRSNAYYMQPAQITSLSESISVMGFEETSALPGTSSPYGVEVVNNGLYHPLFHGLLKSTANNYNLSTRSMSDTIQNMWRMLQSHEKIVSAQLDNRIYYLVHNIFGESLEEHCRGNEVWVIDIAAKTPHWSRWKVQGVSLRAMSIDDNEMMSVVRPDGIFVFNEDRYVDERFNAVSGDLETVNIPWYLETNTQGANRAHDAWCGLQQSNIMVGNFLGQMRYGIRGQDVNGAPVLKEKVLLSSNPPPSEPIPGELIPTLAPTEREDYLLIQKIIKEWVFFAGSVDDDGVPRFSGGQINAVQYRYTPATVNVGYEYGSVETFEYGQSAQADATTDSGTPKPYVDLSRT